MEYSADTRVIVFETELMGIEGVKAPSVVDKVAHKAEEGIKAAVASKLGEAAEAVKVTLQDSDGDGQEHNEL